MTTKNISQKLIWKVDTIKTAILRKMSAAPAEQEQLRRRIIRRCKSLGRHYEDGNSDIAGYTYHPIYFDGFENIKSHRTICSDRLEAINAALTIKTGDWILDIGANVGYFSFGLERRGAYVDAYELNSDSFEIGAALSKLFGKNVIYINKAMSTETLPFLRARYKAVLLLSVFHWIMKQEGEEKATNLLRELARRTECIFLETPSSLEDAMYKNPHFSSQKAVEKYLQSALPDATFSQLMQDGKWGDRILYKINTEKCDNKTGNGP